MREYLINTTLTFRVDTVDEVLALREELQQRPFCDLVKFSYKTKYNKKTEEEWQVVSATLAFNEEKEPTDHIKVTYEVEY